MASRLANINFQGVSKNQKSAQQKPRAKRPKVRTGCFTCKVRRVKCDETRPQCLRCVRFGADCDGYPPHTRQNVTLNSRILLPKPGTNPPPGLQILATPLVADPSPGPVFEDEREGAFFRMFCQETGSQIAGPFQKSLWKRLIPQMCHAEPFVKHAVIAIGALSMVSAKDISTRQLVNDTTINGCLTAVDYRFALKHYDKALAKMRAAIANRQHDARKALLACILVYAFETLHGTTSSAVQHAESGLMLLHRLLKEHSQQQSPFVVPREWVERNVDEDIIIAFSTLDMQIMFFGDKRPAWVHQQIVESTNGFIEKMPTAILTLSEANQFWTLIMRRNYHFVVLALRAAKILDLEESHTRSMDDDGCVQYSSDQVPGAGIFQTHRTPPMEYWDDYIKYQEEISRWEVASASLLERIHKQGNQEQKVTATLLEFQAVMNHVMICGVYLTSEEGWDQFLPEFKRMLNLATYAHPYLIISANGCAIYHFDLGIIVGLALIAFRCRDSRVRGKTIDLLKSVHYREGAWDSQAVGVVGGWLRDLEEEGADENGYIPSEIRAVITGTVMDLPSRLATVNAIQGTNEHHVPRTALLAW
ncbi:hypothetical protein BGZ60DRAFT_392851 [Tricladium varicosporioides]|nr:hypothetical protein BGZ60DRAFT_392851 [Hymenoscyphus varicosporioides]